MVQVAFLQMGHRGPEKVGGCLNPWEPKGKTRLELQTPKVQLFLLHSLGGSGKTWLLQVQGEKTT